MNTNGNYSGRVIDEDGEGLPSANIYLSNSSKGDVPQGSVMGTSTDVNGNFNMSQYNTTNYKYIVSSYLGYKKNVQELDKIDEQDVLFKMIPEGFSLQEFEVVASGKKNRRILAIASAGAIFLLIAIIIKIKNK